MSSHDHRYLEMLPAYALGALDAEELRELQAHLSTDCVVCEAELAARRADVEQLAASLPAVEPSETTRRRVLQRVEESIPSRRASYRIAAVLAVGLLALGWLYVQLKGEVEQLALARNQDAARLAALQSDLAETRSELERLQLADGIVASPSRAFVTLAGLGQAGEAFGQAFVEPNERRAVFYAYGLRPTEEGRTYQLWFISNGTPVSAGLFQVDERGRAMLLVEDVAPVESIEAWAVTVEPEGGVPQPTGPMVLKG